MTDIRVKDLDESAVPGADYWLLTDSATDGPKKVKPSNIVTKADIGLGNVDNTSDANKPISTAVQTALDGKATAAQGAKADTAVQPGDLGGLAVKDKITAADVDAIGTPSSSTWWRGDGAWATPAGGGDMLRANDLSDVDDANASLKNLGGSATFDTRTLAASYSPKTAPDSITTRGYASVGDGGGARYKRNGTTTGDLVITLFDGVTVVGYDIASKTRTFEMYGAKGDGIADDLAAITAAFSKRGRINGIEGAEYLISDLPPAITEKIVFEGGGCLFTITNGYTAAVTGESLFRVQGARSVFRNFTMKCPVPFDTTNIFGGLTGVMIDADYVRVEDAEIYGFSRNGIEAGPGSYINKPVVKRVNSHNNRAAGVMFNNTQDGVVKHCDLNSNGVPGYGGIGYGFANNSVGNAINTKLLHNNANDNLRSGLDAHTGTDGQLIGNRMRGNRTCGVNIMDVTGRWTLKNNDVWGMTYDPTGTAIQPVLCAFLVGEAIDASGGGSLAIFHLEGNNVWDFSVTGYVSGATICPILLYANNRRYTLVNNQIDVGTVVNLVLAVTGGTAGTASPYDVEVTGNTFSAIDCKGFPCYFNSDVNNFRRIAVNDNAFNITTGDNLGAIVRYENGVSRSDREFIVMGNSAALPSITDVNFIGFTTRGGQYELFERNFVNGRRVADWTGFFYILYSNSVPTTGFWNIGDRVVNTTATAGGPTGWRCTTAGSPGTWKAEANLAA